MAVTLNKKNIEAIFPLSTTQQGLLFHSLSSTFDQGFLNLQCDVEGIIEPSVFEKAWNLTIQRHAIMRTTVHWEKIEKPVQIVHKTKAVILELLDWNTFSKVEKEKKWEDLKKENRKNGVDFNKGALLEVKLISFEPLRYRLLWTNHHLLLDGWSSNIILKEVFAYYKSLVSNEPLSFEPLPAFKSYLRWVGQKNPEDARTFWSAYFNGLKKTTLINKLVTNTETIATSIERSFTEQDTSELKNYAKRTKVTLNTIIQGIWSLVLCRYFNTTDVVHGTTVSGRTSDFVNIELLTGMYSKVHPVRNFFVKEEEELSAWFGKIQKRQSQASAFEHLDLEDIMAYVDPELGRPLFDSLLIFENYPVVATTTESLVVSNFKSGVTSTYPITMVILPGKEMKAVLTLSDRTSQWNQAQWLLDAFMSITKIIVSNEAKSIMTLIEKVGTYSEVEPLRNGPVPDKIVSKFTAPRNEIEKQLVAIWEETFGTNGIGIHDNFFTIGGKSMLAVKLFAAINSKMSTKLYPTALMEHPTIASLGSIFKNKDESTAYKYLVPINSQGNKPPLFCVHGGGAHVFFFHPLAKALGSDRPVYALQPEGIYDGSKMHLSIEEMAQDYADEISTIQPEGPYNILVYCFSTAVGIEMALRWKKKGQETNMIIIDSLVDQEDFTDPSRVKLRIRGFIGRMVNNPFKAIKMGFSNHISEFIKGKQIDFVGTEDERNLEKVKRNLVDIYNAYEWKQEYPGRISLFLTKKDDMTLNKVYLENWERLAENKISVVHVEGEHHQLFEEPFVIHMAQYVDIEMI